jgi:hypothetical protein
MDLPIMIKEALALKHCLLSLQECIKNKRIVAKVLYQISIRHEKEHLQDF